MKNDDLISRKQLKETFDIVCSNEVLRRQIGQYIDAAPVIDPESLRPKGRWENRKQNLYDMDGSFTGTCSVCKRRLRFYVEDFCPKCGADMRGNEGA